MCPKQVIKHMVTVAKKRRTAEDYYPALSLSLPCSQQFSRHEALLVAVGCHRVADPTPGRKGEEPHLDKPDLPVKTQTHTPTQISLLSHTWDTKPPSDPQEDVRAFSKNSFYLVRNYFYAVWP